MLKSTCRKLSCLSACKKPTLSLTYFEIMKDTANLLFWELWESLTIHIKNHSNNLHEIFILICMHKINFITHFFLKILLRKSKLIILGSVDIPGHPNLKWYYQFEETWCLTAGKKSTSYFTFSLIILQIYCKLVFGYFGHGWLHTVMPSACRKL